MPRLQASPPGHRKREAMHVAQLHAQFSASCLLVVATGQAASACMSIPWLVGGGAFSEPAEALLPHLSTSP